MTMAEERAPGSPLCLYVNVTFACNSACVFCASDSPALPVRRDLVAERVISAYERLGLGDGDRVIFNGGEPTIYDQLPELAHAAADRRAHVTLFSNGRRLSSEQRVRKLVAAGVQRFSIPVYGSPEVHDALTLRDGSLEETMTGIRHIAAIREESGRPIRLELKLLAVAPAIEGWPDTVDVLSAHLKSGDMLVISGLHMWSPAVASYSRIAPSLGELEQHINTALDRVVSHGIRAILWSIPLCVLDQRHLERFVNGRNSTVRSEGISGRTTTIYFDPDQPDGCELPQDEFDRSGVHPTCLDCALFATCGDGSVFARQMLRGSSDAEIASFERGIARVP